MSKHLARKGAFFYTHTWNKTFGEKVGMYPKFNPGNTERYKRAGVFMRAMMKEFKMKDFSKKPVYHGTSDYEWANLFQGGESSVTRNTFTSFTYDFGTARSFGQSGVILKFIGKAPVIIYDQIRYLSEYSNEEEVLFPPGTFKVQKQSYDLIKGFVLFSVTFTPKKDVNFEELEKRANRRFRFRYLKKTPNKPTVNLNKMWLQKKFNESKDELAKIIYINYPRVRNMNHTNPLVRKMNNTLIKRTDKLMKRLKYLQSSK